MRKADAFPGTYLGKDDLEKPIIAIIADVRLEEIQSDHGRSDKPVLFFEDEDMKPMILNATNWNTIEAVCGEETEDWTGQRIELYVDPGVSWGGKKVGGVRVRVPSSARTARATAEKWSWATAQEKAGEIGITVDALKARLKELGQTGYNAARDTATVQQMIAEVQGQEPLDDDIPF